MSNEAVIDKVRRFKIVFWVWDMDAKENLTGDLQCVLEFKPEEFERGRSADRVKLAEKGDASDEVLDAIVSPMHLSWAREIVDAGFLPVSKHAKAQILERLGFPSEDEVFEKFRQVKNPPR